MLCFLYHNTIKLPGNVAKSINQLSLHYAKHLATQQCLLLHRQCIVIKSLLHYKNDFTNQNVSTLKLDMRHTHMEYIAA